MPRTTWNLLLTLLLSAGVLTLAEGSVRVAEAAGALPSPEPYLWHRREMDIKLRQMQKLHAERTLDVLFLGSSLAYTGVNPAVFNRAYQVAAGQSIQSYNAGLAAVSLNMNSQIFERIIMQYIHPKTVFLILSPRDLNQNNPITQGVDREVMASTYGQALLSNGPQAWLGRFLLDHSKLYRYRNLLMLGLVNGLRFPASLPASFDDPKFDSLGYVQFSSNLAKTIESGTDPDPSKFAELSLMNFQVNGKNLKALEMLIRYCQENIIQLVLVNMPMTSYQMKGFRHCQEDYWAFQDAVSRLVQESVVPFWDFNQAPLIRDFSDQDFGDVFHLNTQGAVKLSEKLGAMYAQWSFRKGGYP